MQPKPSTSMAALWMVGSVASFLAMMVAGRETTRDLDIFQVLELRSLIGILILMPLVVRDGGLAAMRTQRPLLHLGRNVAHYAGQAAWLYALMLIPVAELVSIEFTTPIWTALLASTLLGERLTPAKLGAIGLGLLGVLVIVRPNLQTVDAGHLWVLGSAVFFGVSLVMSKSLTRTESVVRIIFWMLVIQSVLGLVPAALAWQTPRAEVWPWLMLIAFTGMSSHFCLTRALSYADATIVSPMDFARVPLAALVGWALYDERIDMFTALGAMLILSGNLLNIPKRRRSVQPPPSVL